MSDSAHRDRLRRLRVLQAVASVDPLPLGERSILAAVKADHELAPDLEKVRRSCIWLATTGFVSLVRAEPAEWLAAYIMPAGRDWLRGKGNADLQIHPAAYEAPPPGNRVGRASSVLTLPVEVRSWLDQQLVEQGFRDYTDLANALKGKGWTISRSAVYRYGKKLERVIAERTARAKERAELARALAGEFGPDSASLMEGALGTALIRVMDAIDDGAYNPDADSLAGLVKAIPSIGRGFSQAAKHRAEQEARRAALREAADRVDAAAKERGLSAADAKFWRERVLMGM